MQTLKSTSTIGARIRAVRLRTGLPQDQFASALGYSKRSLVSWEADAAEPPIAILGKLREVYDIDPEWIVLGEDYEPRTYFGPVDWDRLDRLARDIDAVCVDVGLKLKPEKRTALARILYDGGTDAGHANKRHLRAMLLTLSQGD